MAYSDAKELIAQGPNKYKSVASICKTAHASVVKAVCEDDTTVALKIVSSKSTQNDLFILQQGLQHKNIVQLLGHFTGKLGDNRWFTVMVLEYTPHGTLATRGGIICDELALHYTRQVLEGLAFLHMRGILHLDVKPANVLVFSTDAEHEEVKLCDFGYSVLASDHKSGYRGTINYMCPEIAESKAQEFSDKCDVWAAACVLYFLVCGRAPFDCGTVAKTFAAISSMQYTPCSAAPAPRDIICKIHSTCFQAVRPSAQQLLDDFFCEPSLLQTL